MEKKIVCTSCSDNLVSEEDYSIFKCPACMKQLIIRCKKCRRKGITYTCGCGFEGP